MAIVFPAPTSYIADILRVPRRSFRLEERQEQSGIGSGEILVADLAPERWVAEIQTKRMARAEAGVLQTRLEALRGALHAFYLYDPWKCVPAADPHGAILGSATPTIHTIGGDSKSLRIEGLPAGYVLSERDMLAFDYGTDPERRALHRVAETVTASGAGVTPIFEVIPHIRPGAAVGAPVHLIKPAAKMRLVPGSLSDDGHGGLTTISFRAIQTFR